MRQNKYSPKEIFAKCFGVTFRGCASEQSESYGCLTGLLISRRQGLTEILPVILTVSVPTRLRIYVTDNRVIEPEYG
ncbi:MAG: hypothetical protein LBT09_00535 [Planctomycetaceae bacterium]|nr:hypothetical protein [Planctomycetaceae bacterium]